MDPLKILIHEHILILKVIKSLEHFLQGIPTFNPTVDLFLSNVIDFFQNYADKTHHGKEENIFFKKLQSKPLTEKEKTILQELLLEHAKARKLIQKLLENRPSFATILEEVIALYKAHIQKENRKFFLPAFIYFSDAEKKTMSEEFLASETSGIQEKYQKLAEKIDQYV